MVYIVTKYDFDSHKVHILYTVDNYKDSLHLCFDKIIEDIQEYRKTDDQIIINSTHSIMVYRRGMLFQGKYELFHYVIHEHPDEEDDEE